MKSIPTKLFFILNLLVYNFSFSQIQFLPYVSISTGSWPTVVAIGDINNDGLNDVVMGNRSYANNPNDFKLMLFIQNNFGTLNTPTILSYTNSYQNISSINLTDLNQDGLKDILIGYHSKIGIFYQNNTHTFNPMIILETSNLVVSVKSGDLNNDSINDFAVSYDNTGFFTIYSQTEPGVFTLQNYPKPNFMTYKELEIGDVNNDGKNDIVAVSSNPSNIYTYLQNEQNSFETYSWVAAENLYGIGIGDLNNDSKPDVAYSKGGNSPNSKIGILYTNNSPEIYQPTIELPTYDIPEPVCISDLNNDGKNEIICAHGGWMKVSIFEQNNMVFNSYSLHNIPYASSYNNQGMDVGDINNDGKKDIVLADYNNGLVILYNNSVLKNTSFIAKTATIIPNPATDYFSIQLPTNAETFYEIYDSNGKLLIENRVENTTPISVNQLQKGFYFVVIRSSAHQETHKLIKY